MVHKSSVSLPPGANRAPKPMNKPPKKHSVLRFIFGAVSWKLPFKAALKIAPDDPSLPNNLGLSYLLSNKLPDAEYTLRRAASLPGADSRVRQNLALVLGVQGKYDEAVEVATAELDTRQAKANIAYLQAMMQSRQSS